MARVPVDITPDEDPVEAQDVDEGVEVEVDVEDEPGRGKRRRKVTYVEVEVERERTKRQLIDSITHVIVVVLYMAFTLLREREQGVVVVDGGDGGPEDDWAE